MTWPILCCVLLLLCVALQLRWRRRFTAETAAAKRNADLIRSEHEAEVARHMARQQALFDSMAAGLLVLDSSGRIQLANHSFLELFGISGEPRGKLLAEVVRSASLLELAAMLNRENRISGKELRLEVPTERWLEVNAANVPAEDPTLAVSIIVFHDFTRIKRLEDTRKEFVANVSHELRTPLSIIQGSVETLLDGAKDDPDMLVKFLVTIERNAHRLKLLMDDLLVISELESGKRTLNLQTANLKAIANKVLQDLANHAQTRSVTLNENLPDLSLRADPVRLEQVFANLVDNAIKYGKNGGAVTISARVEGATSIEVQVKDDGPGIPTHALSRVFERFYRVDKGRSREQGGTGLGLAIVKHIVQAHGGRVWAESQPGYGATFFFTLPLASGHRGQSDGQPVSPAARHDSAEH